MSNVVVTGIGLATPLGLGCNKTWSALLLSKSAVGRDPQFKDMLSARITGLDVPPEARMLSMAFLAAAEAVADGGIDGRLVDRSRIGCTLSVSKPNIQTSSGKISFSDMFSQSAVGRQVAGILKLGGPVINLSAACATGAISVIRAARLIEEGVCDAVIAGAAESPFHPLYIAGFSQMGVLAENIACPFDIKREGFALGEGAGALILERKDSAVMRGAKIYGEITGWGMSNDTCDAVAFDGGGESVVTAVQKALEMSGAKSIDYVNTHGTGTKLNDIMETKAYRSIFGAAANNIAFSSTKAATGHMLGASGAVEIAFALMSAYDSAVPPTLNLVRPDPECGLDYTPREAVHKEIRSAMSVSFGFGGQTAAVCVAKL